MIISKFYRRLTGVSISFKTAAKLLLTLSLIISVAGCGPSGEGEKNAYEIVDVTSDGWLTPESKLVVKVPDAGKQVVVKLEVPGWMPFAYPVKLQTKRDGQIEKTYEFAHPGTNKIQIPLDKAGTIALKIDNWFVPAQLNIGSSDERQLSYRLEGVETKDSSAK